MRFAEHVYAKGVLGRLDSRVKLAAVLVLLCLVLSSHGPMFPAVAAVSAVAVCLLLGVSVRSLALRFSEPLFIAAVLLVLKSLFSGAGAAATVTVAGASVVYHAEGLGEGLLIGSRILGAVGILAVLGFSTPFNELLAAFTWYRVPKGFVEVLLLAYRYIFLLFEEAFTIYHAQKNRLGYASIGSGFRSFGVLAGSLTIRAFEHSQSTALAMAQRGYDGAMPVNRMQPFRPLELVFTMLFIVAVGGLWTLQ